MLPIAPAGWELKGCLGSGASSDVWLAEHIGSAGRAAIKFGRSAADAAILAREAERLLAVESPLFPRVVDAGWAPSRGGAGRVPFLALEWLPGEPLDVRGTFADDRERLVLGVARDVGEGLAMLHRCGTAHGDVKPANILLCAGRARLIDLGLASAADEREVTGGTPRYLAPEAFEAAAFSDARARDSWALGVTLADLAQPGRQDPGDVDGLPAALRKLVAPLLARSPAARPSADWIWHAALDALGESESAAAARQRRRAAVRSAYLSVRAAELGVAARAEQVRYRGSGCVIEWLERTVELARRISSLRHSGEREGIHLFGDMDVLGRATWLVRLIGPSAASWPIWGGSDASLAERLFALAEDNELAGITFAQLEGRRESTWRTLSDPVSLALELSRQPGDASVWAAAERYVQAHDHELLRLALGTALRRAGDLGRALIVLQDCAAPLVQAEAAETQRRCGDWQGALRRLDALDPNSVDESTRARVMATRARIELERTGPNAALQLLETAPDAAATLETRALAWIAAGDRPRARAALDRARLLATTDEERARVQAVLGNMSHAAGDPERALDLFQRAAEYAAHAGAVLEEASYLTGLAASASDLGELGTALDAANRATLLFEHVGRAPEAARAVLSRAATYAQAGAVLDTERAAFDAISRSRRIHDKRCQAYAHLALSDVLASRPREALEHAERARSLLEGMGVEDELRAAARVVLWGGALDLAGLDTHARGPTISPEVRLEWWGARAERCARAAKPQDGEIILSELAGLAMLRAPTAVRGAALARGVELATRLGDGEAARRLASSASDAARELLRRAPAELQVHIALLPWVSRSQSGAQSHVSPEQVRDVEGLVRALSERDQLRTLLDRVLDALVLWTGVERGLLLLRAPGDRLVARAARNLARADLTGTQLQLSMSLAERALSLREPVVAVDASGELSEVFASVHALKLRSVLAVPLLARGEAVGVVYLDDRVRRGAFGPAELAWVRLVASIAAIAIAEARDQLLLRRTALRARRAERRLAEELARREAELDRAERELARSRDQRETRFAYGNIIGDSPAVRSMLRVVDRVTTSEVPVLVLGESGSGKELIARAIHENGPRGRGPFVSENCAAIPEGLLESTLFGHVRGAFTGAMRPRAGLFEVAHNGSLFLDEIADMSLGMQTKLLRVLEEGELRPVGSERPRKVDVRVIGATHRDLDAMVAAGTFRRDLLYRLNVISIRVPALRERSEDIPVLVRHFVGRYAGGRAVRFSPAALAALTAYEWPGNVRQLENEVRRALVLADELVDVRHLSAEIVDRRGSGPRNDGLNLRDRVDALELELVTTALRRTGGNQTRAAELLGLSRFGLQKMMKRLDVSARVYAGLPAETELIEPR